MVTSKTVQHREPQDTTEDGRLGDSYHYRKVMRDSSGNMLHNSVNHVSAFAECLTAVSIISALHLLRTVWEGINF